MKQYQKQYKQITANFWRKKKRQKKEKSKVKGKRFEKKVQSNFVTLKIMKAKILMFSIQKIKVKKK